MASRAGAARARAAASPPHMIDERPGVRAHRSRRSPGSRGRRPRGPRTRSASSRATAGAMVLISTSTGGGDGAASMASTTSRTSSESVTHEQREVGARRRPRPPTGPGWRAGPRRGPGCARRGAPRGRRRRGCAPFRRPSGPAPTKPISTRPRYRPPRPGGGKGVRAVPTLDPVAGGALPRRPETLCPSATSLRTAARGQWERPSIGSVPEPGRPSRPPWGWSGTGGTPSKGESLVQEDRRNRLAQGWEPRYPPARDHPAQRPTRGSAAPCTRSGGSEPGSRPWSSAPRGGRSRTTSPAWRANSRTTRSWRRCRSCFVLVSIVGLVARARHVRRVPRRRRRQRDPRGAARAAAVRAQVGDREHRPGGPVPGHRSARRPLRVGQRHGRPGGRPRPRRATCPTGRGCAASWSPWSSRSPRALLVVATTLALIGGSRLVEALAEQIFGRARPTWPGAFLYLIGTASLLLFTVAVYHFGPNAPRRPLLASLPGAVVGRGALGRRHPALRALHRQLRGSYETVYGALAGAAIYLIFLFLTCVSLLIGAEVNEQVVRRCGRARRADEVARHGGLTACSALAGRGTSRWCGWRRPARATGCGAPQRRQGRPGARRPRCARGSTGGASGRALGADRRRRRARPRPAGGRRWRRGSRPPRRSGCRPAARGRCRLRKQVSLL